MTTPLTINPSKSLDVDIVQMKPRRLSLMFGVLSLFAIVAIPLHTISFMNADDSSPEYLRSSSSEPIDLEPIDLEPIDLEENMGPQIRYHGIAQTEWCSAPQHPPLPFEDCKNEDFLFRFYVHDGLANALNYVLRGVIWAYQEDACFFIDEKGPSPADISEREPPLENIDPFLERYFEPMSLPRDHPKVQWALENHKFVEPAEYKILEHEYNMITLGITHADDPIRHFRRDIESLSLFNQDNILAKKYMLRRLFRILPKMREIACQRLTNLDLDNEFIALSIRRGDNNLDNIESPLDLYIEKTENAIETHFEGIVPKIFVASDDCNVMGELRQLRPDWNFVSECDNATDENGFRLGAVKQWTEERTDEHYTKFIAEMIAMAGAKFFIGSSNTHVAYWVYFMRRMDAQDDTWQFIDTDDAIW